MTKGPLLAGSAFVERIPLFALNLLCTYRFCSCVPCSVCGTKYSFENGATGMFPKVPKSGPAALFSDIMSSSGGGPIEAYEVKTAPTGKVYAAMPKL